MVIILLIFIYIVAVVAQEHTAQTCRYKLDGGEFDSPSAYEILKKFIPSFW